MDLARLMFQARRKAPRRPATVVLSHCSVQDVNYVPALKAYCDFLAQFPEIDKVTHKLCVYDDLVLSDPEIDDIDTELNPLSFILMHHSELGRLIPELR